MSLLRLAGWSVGLVILAGCGAKAPPAVPGASAPAAGATQPEKDPQSPGDKPVAPDSKTASARRDLTKDARPLEELKLVEPRRVSKIGFLGSMSNFQFSKDGKSAYVAQSTLDSNGIVVYDTATWEPGATWKSELKDFEKIVLSDDGSTLVGAHAKGRVSVWDTATGSFVRKFDHTEPTGEIARGELRGLAVSPDGKRIASSNFDLFEYVVWDSHTGEIAYRRPTKWIDLKPAAYSPTGDTLVIWGEDKGLDLCDAASGEPRLTIPVGEPRPNHIRISPDGRSLLVVLTTRIEETTRGYAALFDMKSGDLLWNVETGVRWLNGYEFSPDGSMVVLSGHMHGEYSADRDQPYVVQFRGRDDGRLRFAFHTESRYSQPELAFSPNGKLLAVGPEICEVPASEGKAE